MIKFLDTLSGELHVTERITLRGGLTDRRIVSAGLPFVREIDMRTGWVFRTTGPHILQNHTVQFSLGFHGDALRRVTFAFTEERNLNIEDLFAKHNSFLRQEVGIPDNQNDRIMSYKFGWGGISSEIDPRNGTSSITITWI